MADIGKRNGSLFIVLVVFSLFLQKSSSERAATDHVMSPGGSASLTYWLSNFSTIQLTPVETASNNDPAAVNVYANSPVETRANVQHQQEVAEIEYARPSAPPAEIMPFSDIYHAPGQQVINVNGLPQYEPANASQPWCGPKAPGQAGAAQTDQPEFEGYNAAISRYRTHVTEAGVTYGDGTLDIYAKNGTLVYQTPFSAPLVPKDVLQRRLELMKIISSGQYTTVRACSAVFVQGLPFCIDSSLSSRCGHTED